MRIFLALIGIIAILATPFLFYQAFEKYTNHYHASSDFGMLNNNVYLGSDSALNISNSNYFTAFSVLGIQSLLFGLFCIGVVIVSGLVEEGYAEMKQLSKRMAASAKESIGETRAS